MVEGNASMYLGSPRMAEMVIGEVTTLEEMGGARMHCTVSGCGDNLAASDSDALEMADELGGRLRHVHLADGGKPGLPDEHLVPGRGSQPCGPLLERLAAQDYAGIVVVEISTRRALTDHERRIDLVDSLAFARVHLAAPSPVP